MKRKLLALFLAMAMLLALTACGMDAANFAGYSMIAPLGDFDKTTGQGINGTLYALLALDCGN